MLHKCDFFSLQVSEGKTSSVAPETMKTDPDSKAKGELFVVFRNKTFVDPFRLRDC